VQWLVYDGCQGYREAKYRAATAFLAPINLNHAFSTGKTSGMAYINASSENPALRVTGLLKHNCTFAIQILP
jgi:hypothetical protein